MTGGLGDVRNQPCECLGEEHSRQREDLTNSPPKTHCKTFPASTTLLLMYSDTFYFFQAQGSYPLVPNRSTFHPSPSLLSRFCGFSKQNVFKWRPVNFTLWPPGGQGSFALWWWERTISLILLGLQRRKKEHK